MAEKKPENPKSSQVNADSGSTSVGSLNVGGDVEGSVAIGNNISIINNYYPVIKKNTEQHEPDYWALKHPYPMPPNFTGRVHERAMLTQWVNEDTENRLFIPRALGGFGKSALSWQWLSHDVKPEDFPKVLWWSFYEGDASFEHFIEETLEYLNVEPPQGQRPQVDALLKAMQSQKILLIMDGFERALRAYSSMNAAYQGDEADESPSPAGRGARGEGETDCVNINAEIFIKSICSLPNIKSKVLMTTRLTPRTVKPRGEFILGCYEVELTSMQPADAVEFFHKQKIKGTHAEIEAACAPYGYHPLSLRLLSGRILKDFESPADIVVAQKLKIDGDIIQQKHHVLEVSYNSLPPDEQKLLSTIACFRSPVEHKTLESIEVRADGRPPLPDDLHNLVERGLLHFDEKNKKFDLHPIVRRYTYERLTIPDRTAAHTRLRDYFSTKPVPNILGRLSTEMLANIIELYHHTICTERYDDATRLIFNYLFDPPWFKFDDYNARITLLNSLFPYGIDSVPQVKDKGIQASIISELAKCYGFIGQSSLAVKLLERSLSLWADDYDVAIDLSILAHQQLILGKLKKAEQNLTQSIELLIDEEKILKSHFHNELGRVFIYEGRNNHNQREHCTALTISKKDFFRGLVIFQSYLNRIFQLLLFGKAKKALHIANRAQELRKYPDNVNFHFPEPEDEISVDWLFGAALIMEGKDLNTANKHLTEALMLCRRNNIVELEPEILITLAKLHQLQNSLQEAKSLADEALLITERCGYVLQGADVNLFLAQYALEQEKNESKAKEYAEEALKLATCDGPPYYYKVAYEEAERFLEDLGG